MPRILNRVFMRHSKSPSESPTESSVEYDKITIGNKNDKPDNNNEEVNINESKLEPHDNTSYNGDNKKDTDNNDNNNIKDTKKVIEFDNQIELPTADSKTILPKKDTNVVSKLHDMVIKESSEILDTSSSAKESNMEFNSDFHVESQSSSIEHSDNISHEDQVSRAHTTANYEHRKSLFGGLFKKNKHNSETDLTSIRTDSPSVCSGKNDSSFETSSRNSSTNFDRAHHGNINKKLTHLFHKSRSHTDLNMLSPSSPSSSNSTPPKVNSLPRNNGKHDRKISMTQTETSAAIDKLLAAKPVGQSDRIYAGSAKGGGNLVRDSAVVGHSVYAMSDISRTSSASKRSSRHNSEIKPILNIPDDASPVQKILVNSKLNEEFLSKYSIVAELGAGGFGFVLGCLRNSDHQSVAVKFIIKKKIPKLSWTDDEVYGRIPLEAYIIKHFHHINIVDFVDYYDDSRFCYLVMEMWGVDWYSEIKAGLVHPLMDERLVKARKSACESKDNKGLLKTENESIEDTSVDILNKEKNSNEAMAEGNSKDVKDTVPIIDRNMCATPEAHTGSIPPIDYTPSLMEIKSGSRKRPGHSKNASITSVQSTISASDISEHLGVLENYVPALNDFNNLVPSATLSPLMFNHNTLNNFHPDPSAESTEEEEMGSIRPHNSNKIFDPSKKQETPETPDVIAVDVSVANVVKRQSDKVHKKDEKDFSHTYEHASHVSISSTSSVLHSIHNIHHALHPHPLNNHLQNDMEHLKMRLHAAEKIARCHIPGVQSNGGLSALATALQHKLWRKPSMDLFEHIEKQQKLDDTSVRNIFVQIVSAVEYLHANGIAHRDIKDENIVIDDQQKIKLIDFGSAIFCCRDSSDVLIDKFQGTVNYASPEIIRGDKYWARPSDIWALGILLYMLLYKQSPFKNSDSALKGRIRKPKNFYFHAGHYHFTHHGFLSVNGSNPTNMFHSASAPGSSHQVHSHPFHGANAGGIGIPHVCGNPHSLFNHGVSHINASITSSCDSIDSDDSSTDAKSKNIRKSYDTVSPRASLSNVQKDGLLLSPSSPSQSSPLKGCINVNGNENENENENEVLTNNNLTNESQLKDTCTELLCENENDDDTCALHGVPHFHHSYNDKYQHPHGGASSCSGYGTPQNILDRTVHDGLPSNPVHCSRAEERACQAMHLITWMLRVEPLERPCPKQISEHAWCQTWPIDNTPTKSQDIKQDIPAEERSSTETKK